MNTINQTVQLSGTKKVFFIATMAEVISIMVLLAFFI